MLTCLLSTFLLLISPEIPLDSIKKDVLVVSDSTDSERVRIDKIFIIGNKKTRKQIILRELDVEEGQVYDAKDLKDILEADKNKIFNTRLFTSVEITTLNLNPNLIDVVIKVSERWYTFPVPIFDLVDRNFNDWWSNQNHDLSRTNYGVKIYQSNFRGRNESLRVLLQLGFTKQFGLRYKIPYIDKSQRHGLSFGFDYSENKTIAYRTSEHKQVFFDIEELLLLRRKFELGYFFRNSFYTRHSVIAVFNSNAIADTVANLNNNYYKNGETTQRFFELTYGFQRDKRDIVSYPLKGNKIDAIITKYGLGIFNDLDMLSLKLKYTQYSPLNKGFYFANYTSLYVSGPSDQPYTHLDALGYKNDFVRGYELFLIEGQNYYLNRSTLKKQIFSRKSRLGFMPVEQFKDFSLAIYLKTYLDIGYAENLDRYAESQVNTTLSNRYLVGTGFGIDFVTYYDTVLRFEYSFTRENTSGFFFHLKKEF